MNSVRRAFLDASAVAGTVVERPDVRDRWDGGSALAELSIGALAGHLVRATGSVPAYLDRPEPVTEAPIGPAEYYARALDTFDLSSDLHRAIRRRSEEEAAAGYDGVVARLRAAQSALEKRLEEEPEQRLVRVFKDLVLRLDDYLITRIVETVVHTDDLAGSLGVETPAFDAYALELAIGNLVDVARFRHGDIAVIRALARRERDEVDALRVL